MGFIWGEAGRDFSEKDSMSEEPQNFTLKDLLEEVTTTYRERKDFINGRLAANKPVAPSKDLAMWRLSRLEAVGKTLRQLYEEEQAALKRRAARTEDDF